MSSDDLARSLGDALRDHGIYGVRVDVSGDRVWLTGSVSSVEHKDLALTLATATPGVADVKANIALARPDYPGERPIH